MELPTYTQLIKLLNSRYSCRDFDPSKDVSDDNINKILEAARLAQSAVNRQPWTFVVVRDNDTKAKILAKSRPAFMEAPVVIVACGHHDQAWQRPLDGKDHTDVDLSIAIENICLATTTLGLATCWVCSFDVPATREALSLPADIEPVALLPLGYAKTSDIPAKTRKSLEEIVRWEKF